MRKIFEYGPIIRAKRQEKHMKAKDLAKDLDITPAFLSLIESNQRKPDGDTLLKILEILELEKNDLTKKSDPDLESRTKEIVKIITERTLKDKIFSVAGGGETVAAINKFNKFDSFTFVSTAGGAFLEFLEGKKLPGITAIN